MAVTFEYTNQAPPVSVLSPAPLVSQYRVVRARDKGDCRTIAPGSWRFPVRAWRRTADADFFTVLR
jgi:hypothetical protein